MYCVKCGHPAEDGNTYCANCGAELQKPIVIPEDDDVPQDTIASNDAAEKRMRPLLIFGACVVVILALVFLFLNFTGVKNWFLRTTSTPENLLLITYKQSMNRVFSPIMENYDKFLDAVENPNSKNQAQIVLNPGEQILDTLEYALYAGEGDISWLSEIRLCIDYAIQEKLQEYVLTFGLGERNILSAELITDSQNQKMYLTIPEMSEQALLTDIEQASGIASSDMDALHAALPSQQVLGQLAMRYMDIVFGGFSNVEKYSESLTLDGIHREVTVLEAYIDHPDLLEVFDTFLKQIKADEDIKRIAEQLNPWYNDLMEQSMASYNEYFDSSYVPVDLYEELIALVDELLSQLQEEFKNADQKNHLYLYTYLNDSNEIIGVELVVSGMDEPVSFLTLTNADRYSTQILFGDLQITGGGDCSENLNGSFVISTDEQKILEVVLEDVSQSKGVVYLEPSAAMLNAVASEIGFADSDAMEMADVALCFSFEECEENIQCTINVLSKEDSVLKVQILGKELDPAEIRIPEKFVDSVDEETVYNWYSNMDFEGFFKKLTDIGVPVEFLDLLH